MSPTPTRLRIGRGRRAAWRPSRKSGIDRVILSSLAVLRPRMHKVAPARPHVKAARQETKGCPTFGLLRTKKRPPEGPRSRRTREEHHTLLRFWLEQPQAQGAARYPVLSRLIQLIRPARYASLPDTQGAGHGRIGAKQFCSLRFCHGQSIEFPARNRKIPIPGRRTVVSGR